MSGDLIPVAPGRFRRATAEEAIRRAQPGTVPCIHRGEPTGQTSTCSTCPGHTELKLLACAVHGKCTVAKPIAGVACCQDCPDYRPPGLTALLTGGIGDIWAVDSFTPPSVRERLEGLVIAAPAAASIRELYQAICTYPRLVSYRVLPGGGKVYYHANHVAEDHGSLSGIEDWSIGVIFPTVKRFIGSSWLGRPLCRPRQIGKPYVVIVPYSAWGNWHGRALDSTDWQVLQKFLEQRNLLGVILHKGRSQPTPKHSHLVNLTNQTSLLESVELLKAAEGYLGIDSALSVLAAQLFPSQRLAIRCVNQHGYLWQHIYWAPHTEFSFVNKTLVAPAWI